MSVSITVPEPLIEELRLTANLAEETAGVMLTGLAEAPNGDLKILARHIRWVEESAYDRRDWNGLTIRSDGYVPALAEAEAAGAFCIWVHTHPGNDGIPNPSKWDRIVDQEIMDLFRLRSGSPYYGTLHAPEFDGRIF